MAARSSEEDGPEAALTNAWVPPGLAAETAAVVASAGAGGAGVGSGCGVLGWALTPLYEALAPRMKAILSRSNTAAAGRFGFFDLLILSLGNALVASSAAPEIPNPAPWRDTPEELVRVGDASMLFEARPGRSKVTERPPASGSPVIEGRLETLGSCSPKGMPVGVASASLGRLSLVLTESSVLTPVTGLLSAEEPWPSPPAWSAAAAPDPRASCSAASANTETSRLCSTLSEAPTRGSCVCWRAFLEDL